MARRSEHSRDELEQLSLQAAYDRIKAEGLKNLSVRKVAQDIGYSPGTLYNVFENMDDLVLRVAARILDEFHAEADRRFADRDDIAGLYQLVDAYVDFAQTNANLWQAVVGYRLAENTSLPDWYLDRVRALLGLIMTGLKPMANGLDDAQAFKAAMTLWASVQGLVSMAGRSKLEILRPDDVNQMARDLVTNYVAGLGRAR